MSVTSTTDGKHSKGVLILVVMEYTQWAHTESRNRKIYDGLNPCCNGIYSMRQQVLTI